LIGTVCSCSNISKVSFRKNCVSSEISPFSKRSAFVMRFRPLSSKLPLPSGMEFTTFRHFRPGPRWPSLLPIGSQPATWIGECHAAFLKDDWCCRPCGGRACSFPHRTDEGRRRGCIGRWRCYGQERFRDRRDDNSSEGGHRQQETYVLLRDQPVATCG